MRLDDYDGIVICIILVVSGKRREESPRCARMSAFEIEKRLTTRHNERQCYRWRPIIDLTEEDVWASIKLTGLAHHPAYDLGCSRVACALCVLASVSNLRIGAAYNPDLTALYLDIEQEIGHRFRSNASLADILQQEDTA